MTDRQAKILNAIVEQYAEVAAPVGSVLLANLFKVSSATIRAEMVKLEEMGYIQQPHTSAGRVPTEKGYRYYVNRVSEEQTATKPEQNIDRSARAIDTTGAWCWRSRSGNKIGRRQFSRTNPQSWFGYHWQPALFKWYIQPFWPTRIYRWYGGLRSR